jgi:predicted nucleic-acid-binding protein
LIGLDTNVLLRYLVLDQPVQAARAVDIIDRRLTRDDPGFISCVVMAELVWVLSRSYSWDKPMISLVIEHLLAADQLELEHAGLVANAMIALRDEGADFADVLIGQIGRHVGCSHTVTFDRRAARLAGFLPA